MNQELKRQIRVTKLSEQNDDFELKKMTTPTERISLMWQLALDAWAFKGETIAEPRLQRHIVRVFRRES